MEEKLTAIDIIHDKVELSRCLEGVVEIHQKGMAEFLQDVLFRLGVFYLVSRDNCLQ